ncbi:NAD-dependent epimerase/dehydratase family protein [Bacillus kwashiorkori]|uniref:NAD-dependent epimerase/dehydratase family protein n=1 Tax=Bacillus kwashiorkori TaxID=1522318 RepID=UPI000781FCF1|nr:NAD(P)-dependent oxidoreductase [Bacillus kwashiorkori]
MTNKTILITGANGFTGQHACQHFLQKNYHVIGIVRDEATLYKLKQQSDTNHPNLDLIACDITDEVALMNEVASRNIDYVLHPAGKNAVTASFEKPSLYMKTNVLATVYLLEALRKVKNLQKIIVIGSALEYNPFNEPPSHPYGLSKTFQTIVAKTWENLFGLPIIIVKPTNLIGPGPSTGICSLLAEKIVQCENNIETTPITIDDLNKRRDFLDIRDAIAAYEIILQQGSIGEIYPIGTGNEQSLYDVVKTYKQLTSVNIPVKIEKEYKEDKQNKRINGTNFHNLKQLGWEPNYCFKQSLVSILQYYRAKQSG